MSPPLDSARPSLDARGEPRFGAPGLESTPPEAAEDGPGRVLLALALLAATFLSATMSGALQSPLAPPGAGLWDTARWALLHPTLGLPYASALLAILVAHEAGHAVAAAVHRVPASLPYFLPLPLSAIGTLGAVIGLRGEVRSRNALVDIAAAGPLCGLAVALPVLAFGLHLSPVGPSRAGDLVEGQSLLYLGLKLLVKGELLPSAGRDVQLHPVAFAGWVGLLVTSINLIPVGPLDGGHLAAAAGGRGHDRRSRAVHRALPLIGLLVAAAVALSLRGSGPGRALSVGAQSGAPWLLWSVALLALRWLGGGTWAEPLGDEPLTPVRKLVLALMALVAVLLFMPWVMREAG